MKLHQAEIQTRVPRLGSKVFMPEHVLLLDGKPVAGKIIEFIAHSDGFCRVTLELDAVRHVEIAMPEKRARKSNRVRRKA